MRSLLLAAALFTTPAFAEDPAPSPVTTSTLPLVTSPPSPDVTLTLTAQEQTAWTQVGPILDACIGAAVMRADVTNCKGVSQFLITFAAKVAAASPVK